MRACCRSISDIRLQALVAGKTCVISNCSSTNTACLGLRLIKKRRDEDKRFYIYPDYCGDNYTRNRERVDGYDYLCRDSMRRLTVESGKNLLICGLSLISNSLKKTITRAIYWELLS